jgi:hypothetical protein
VVISCGANFSLGFGGVFFIIHAPLFHADPSKNKFCRTTFFYAGRIRIDGFPLTGPALNLAGYAMKKDRGDNDRSE